MSQDTNLNGDKCDILVLIQIPNLTYVSCGALSIAVPQEGESIIHIVI